ncbi:hypothetical protein KC19_3G075600 [Ceratodon purpureus]|uniref:Protein kinase domain-containing protein n=1 Tax=Ceratodon purpureus TaxID=3225 RepID=A0A8T0II23_CERPU|nr:hypothetical protein KC19_3G075600 [Ceratodon purpureus]
MKTEVVLLWVLLLFCERSLAQGQITNFSFPSFVADDNSLLKVDDVSFNGSFESFDINHRTYTTGLLDQECGRLLYKDKVRMVDRASGKAASFSTSFTFAFLQLDPNSTSCGSGMVFMFAARPNISAVEYTRRGKGMCTFDSTDTSPTNRVFAVKFDSALTNVSGISDPSDSNIGVVISSQGTTREHTYNLCGNNITQCHLLCGDKGDFSAWIDYDSAAHTLEVRFRNGSLASSGKPTNPVIRVSEVQLDDSILENEEMYVGFTGSTFWSREVHRIRAWNFNSTALPKSANPPRKLLEAGAIVGIGVAILGAALIGIFLLFRFKTKQREFSEKHKISSLSSSDTPRAFTYRELRRATKNFNDSELLSGGSFGDVFRGTLPSGTLVAVKRIKNNKEQGEESFLAEATSLRQIRHRNLLQLRGWCQAKEGLLLVYDYMSNGSLDKWLFHNDSGLCWNKRHFILAGVASGLAYLHEECMQCVLHRDIKSSNVMLDTDFNPYLGDFGLARLIDHHKLEKTTLLAGTLGYMAPEMHYTGRATKETDVYAFGILVLEVVCGRRPLARQVSVDPDDVVLLDIVWRAHEVGNILQVADPKLLASTTGKLAQFDPAVAGSQEHVTDMTTGGATSEEKKAIANALHVGLLCCLPNPSERPSIRVVSQWLKGSELGAMELPPLPTAIPYNQYSVTSSDGLKTSLSSNMSSFQTWALSEGTATT